MDGLNTALPISVRKIDVMRTLTTESLSVLMPFRVQEIAHKHGIYYGQNAISKNMIVADRRQLMNKRPSPWNAVCTERCTHGVGWDERRESNPKGHEQKNG